MMSTANKAAPDPGRAMLECRGCLKCIPAHSNVKTYHNIFKPWMSPWEGKTSTIARDMAKFANIEIVESDDNPKIICESCCMKLFTACQFIYTIKQVDVILKQRQVYEVPIETDETWPRPIQLEKNVNKGVFGMDVEVKQEVLSDEEYVENEAGYQPGDGYTPDVNMEIKTEPEDIENAPPIKVTVNGTISLQQMGRHNVIVTHGSEIYEDVEDLDEPLKHEPTSESEEQIPDLPLECLLCTKSFKSISGLKAHVIAQHSYKTIKRKTSNSASPEIKPQDKHVCSTCRRSFVTPTDLMVHETCHNKAMCYGCRETCDTFEQLLKHRKRCKNIINKQTTKPKLLEDVMRPVPQLSTPIKGQKPLLDKLHCSICPESFSDTYYMNIHHEIHHSKQKSGEHKTGKQCKKTKQQCADDKLETKALQNMFEQSNSLEQANKIIHEPKKYSNKSKNSSKTGLENKDICQEEHVTEQKVDIAQKSVQKKENNLERGKISINKKYQVGNFNDQDANNVLADTSTQITTENDILKQCIEIYKLAEESSEFKVRLAENQESDEHIENNDKYREESSDHKVERDVVRESSSERTEESNEHTEECNEHRDNISEHSEEISVDREESGKDTNESSEQSKEHIVYEDDDNDENIVQTTAHIEESDELKRENDDQPEIISEDREEIREHKENSDINSTESDEMEESSVNKEESSENIENISEHEVNVYNQCSESREIDEHSEELSDVVNSELIDNNEHAEKNNEQLIKGEYNDQLDDSENSGTPKHDIINDTISVEVNSEQNDLETITC